MSNESIEQRPANQGTNDDVTKRRKRREDQMRQLHQMAEGTRNTETKKRYLRKIKELHNLNVTEAAAVKTKLVVRLNTGTTRTV